MEYEYLNILERKLDDQQKKVCCAEQNTVVAAGAGSGKTQVLATRFAWLVMEHDDIAASSILTLTFTKKAAAEMYSRIYSTLRTFAASDAVPEKQRNNAKRALEDFANVHIQTLDSYCGSVVRQCANRYGIRPDFTTGSADSERIIKDMALAFVLKNMGHAGIRHFTELCEIESFAENVFAKIIISCTSLATRSGYFTTLLEKQKSLVCEGWKELASSSKKGSLRAIFASLRSEVLRLPAGDEFESLKELLNEHPDDVVVNFSFEPSEIESSADELSEKIRSMLEPILTICDFKTRKRTPESVVNTKNYILELKDVCQKLNSIKQYVAEYKYTKDMCSLLDEFLDSVNSRKRQSGALTFKDVTELALKVLIEQKDIRNQEKAAFKRIMIDEFQDNNGSNRNLLFLLSERLDEFTEIPADEEENQEYIHNALKSKIELNKLFFVGDEKQSIYKFRDADVAVFNSLKNDLNEINGEGSYLHMIYNYRSDAETITSFNQLFGSFVVKDGKYKLLENPCSVFEQNSEHLFEALYDENAVAYFIDKKTHEVPAPVEISQKTIRSHLALFPFNRQAFAKKRKNREVLDKQEQFAYYIAKKISEMHEAGEPYSSFAILDRNRTNRRVFQRWLERFRIPYTLDQQSELFAEAPVNDMYTFFRLCVYPSDINAFSAFLCSPLVGLTEQALEAVLGVAIHQSDKKISFNSFDKDDYDKIMAALSYSPLLAERYKSASEFFEKEQPLTLARPITDTLNILWNECGYRYETMLSPNTALFAEHYDLLFELARQCDLAGKGISWFVDQLAMQKESEKFFAADSPDMDTANISYPLEKTDSVQIMTIHKSKGLQFGHVFILGCTGGVEADSEANFFYDEESGVSFKSASGEKNYFFLKQSEEYLLKDIAEFRRVLYVGVTRAERDFYIVGGYEYTNKGEHNAVTNSVLDPIITRYYADFFNKGQKKLYVENAPFDLEVIDEIPLSVLYTDFQDSKSLDELRHEKISNVRALFESLESQSKLVNVPEQKLSHFSPSYLEQLYAEDEAVKNKEKDFASEITENLYPEMDKILFRLNKKDENFGFNTLGTIIHAFMEKALKRIPLSAVEIEFSQKLRKFDGQEKSSLFDLCKKIYDNFASSEYGKKALACLSSGKFFKTEYNFKALIQDCVVTGSIDLAFENEDGSYTIVDYKTDHNLDSQKYYGQQTCYRIALADLLEVPESKISCVLYDVRKNAFAEIPADSVIDLSAVSVELG